MENADVNLDGKITLMDAHLLDEYLNGEEGSELSNQALINSATNCDGILNEIDSYIIRISFGEWCEVPFKMFKNDNLVALDRNDLHLVAGFDIENTKVSELVKNFNIDNGYSVCNIADETLEDNATFGTGTKIKIGGNGKEQIISQTK